MANRTAKREKTRRNDRNGETLFGGSSRNNNEQDDGMMRCPVPMVQCARRGVPIPASVEAGGVKIKCTNQDCPVVKQLVHPECFEQLETNLIKILGNLGSARGWTEAQKRNNLWEKKGHSLIAKYVRCGCGRGQCSRDTEFYMKLNEEKERLEREEKEAKKRSKKGKQKELPRLNYGNYGATVNSTAPTPQVDMSDLFRRPGSSLYGQTAKQRYDEEDYPLLGAFVPVKQRYDDESDYTPLSAPGPTRQIYDDEEFPSLGGHGPMKQRYDDEEEYPPLGAPGPVKQRHDDEGKCPTLGVPAPMKQRHDDDEEEKCPLLAVPGPTKQRCDDEEKHLPLSASGPMKQRREEPAHRSVPTRDKYYTLFGPNSSSFLLGERLLSECGRNK